MLLSSTAALLRPRRLPPTPPGLPGVVVLRRLHLSAVRRLPPRLGSLVPPNSDIDKIRNIGIFAHIDSGKTTLTESVLAHSGYIPQPGSVDTGTTSTDFLPAERARGITIQSASIPVQWQGHTVNVVDTPGHVDFTMEVERAARVVDGAVVVMDGVEGVEGQTEGVWKQLTRYNVRPRILFVNKLDRPGASLPHSILSTSNRLHPLPLLLTLPITSFDSANGKGGEPGIVGLVDIIGGRVWRWEGPRGAEVRSEARVFDEFTAEGETFAYDTPLPSTSPPLVLPPDHPIRQEAITARTALIETLSTHHLPLLEEFFAIEPASDIPAHLLVPPSSIRAAIRSLTKEGLALPVICGSAFKSMGTELVLDAIIDYLPGPGEVGPALVVGGPDPEPSAPTGKGGRKKAAPGWKGKTKGNKTQIAAAEVEKAMPIVIEDKRCVALAFKVVWDDQRGWMTFVRVYSGALTKENLFNSSIQELERPSKLLLLYANHPIEVNSLPTGSIGVLLGLKHTRTGDTLLSNTDSRRLIPGPTRLRGVEIPSAVCSVAIKYSGREEEKVVGEALERLVRQDPSLRLENPTEEELENNPDAQTLLHGMGPLHLEISLNRLEEEQHVRARSGRVKVSMKESIIMGGPAVDVAETWSGTVVGNPVPVEASVNLTIQRLSDAELAALRAEGEGESLAEWAGNSVVIDVDEEDPLVALVPTIAASLFSCISRGGPLMGLPLSHLRIHLTPVSPFEDPTFAAPAAAAPALLDKGKRPKAAISPAAASPSSSASLLASLPPPAAYARAIASAMKKALKRGGPTILEPLVDNRISGVDPSDLGRVVADLVSRGGSIGELGEEAQASLGSGGSASAGEDDGEKPYMPPAWISPSASTFLLADSASADRVQKRTISATMPLAELGDYAGKLRSLSGGGGTFETSDAGWGDVDVSTVRKREEAFLGVD